jgi:hypothetical protein
MIISTYHNASSLNGMLRHRIYFHTYDQLHYVTLVPGPCVLGF